MRSKTDPIHPVTTNMEIPAKPNVEKRVSLRMLTPCQAKPHQQLVRNHIMKRINFWALLASGLIGLPVVAFAQDDAKKPETNQSEELFKKLDKNGDGKLVPDEIPEDQGRFFDRLVRLGDKDDNGELTKEEFDAAIKRSDAPVQGGGVAGGQAGAGGGRPMIDFKQMLERLDKNKDGKLSKDEIPEEGPARFLREMMTRQNKEVLTAEDFEQMRQRMAEGFAGGRPGGFGSGEFLKRLDKNNDGKLQKDELPEGMRDRLAKVFEKLGKTELTQEEFGRAMAELGPPPGAPGAGIPGGRPNLNPEEQFKRMDANGDGKVTLDEVPEQFRDRVRPMFERVKKDVLTLDDVVAFAQAREGDRRPAEGGRGDAARKPEGEARKADGEARRTEGDTRKPEGEARRNAGDRPDTRKPEGNRNPEAGRDGDRRPPEGGRPPEGDRRGPGGDGRGPAEGPRGPGEGRGPGDGPQRRAPLPRFFEILDHNHDGRISREELDRLKEVFAELDRNKDGQLDPSELFGPPPGQEGRGPDGNRPPEGRGPGGQPPRDGDRRPEEGRPRNGGDRPREGADRPREGADRPREGERRPDQRSEGRPQRRDDKGDKPRDKND
jgi:Ca2+-binding EF-hand superfamily protein